MSLILDTYETNTWISDIAENTRKHLVIVCPFLRINQKLRRTIELSDSRGIEIFVIYGKRELDNDTMSWLKGLRHSNIASIADLHAKLYMNEDFAIISSMNLYEFSQVNNEELSVLFGRRQDRTGFKEVTSQLMRLIRISEKEHGKWEIGDLDRPVRGILNRGRDVYRADDLDDRSEDDGLLRPMRSKTEDRQRQDWKDTILCHCIRCGRIIPSTHDYVYCGRCMDSWQRYSNMRYVEPEGHCYICGRPYHASAERPSCTDCYRDNRALISEKHDSMVRASEDRTGNGMQKDRDLRSGDEMERR